MGKTPKKAAPGGDERNLYVRRLKATATAPSKVCDTGSTAKQRESENPNRGKTIAVPKHLLAGPARKVFKSKLRSPATTKSHGALKNPPRFQPPSTSKDETKPGEASSKDQETSSTPPTMQPDSDESAVQLKVSITKKDVKDGGRIDVTDGVRTKEETEASHTTTNGKVAIEPEVESASPRDAKEKPEVDEDKSADKPAPAEDAVEPRDNVSETVEPIKLDETENPSTDCEETVLKLEDEGEPAKPSEQNGDAHECAKNGEEKKIDDEKIESTDCKKIPDNCSVDVVESTTSETSDSGNATQSDKETNEQEKESANDASFVSYDSSIMLKDVQIKLNDCLKDNSKLFDVSNADESAVEQKRHDMSFGKTLRNISGRSTINRLRYVTVREQRFSPNSSLFVNTSAASLDSDEQAGCKLTRHPTDLSDTIVWNGSQADRKRKIVSEAIESAKKLKTEAAERTGLLNTSLEMLKSIRRPVQVSTPNIKGYEFKSDRYEAKRFADDKLIIDADAEPKKWCVVM